MDQNSDIDSTDDYEEVPIARRPSLVRNRINFDFDDFVERFRISRAVMKNVLNNGSPMLQADSIHNFLLSPKEQLLICIRYLASDSFVHVVGDVRGSRKSTLSRKVHKVVTLIIDHYFDNVITWLNDMVSNIVATVE